MDRGSASVVSFWHRMGGAAALFASASALIAAEPALPRLETVLLPDGAVRLSWHSTVPRFVLEAADDLSSTSTWRPAAARIRSEDNRHGVTLDPFAPVGRFFRLRLPLTSVQSTSPARGEQGVSVGRETTFRFTAPLASSALVTTTNFHATFAGRRLLTRCEMAADRQRVSQFYLEPLPGNGRVLVELDTTGLVDELELPVDGDGDGQPGGVARIWFDTLNLTPVTGTAVIGHVYAAAPEGLVNGVPVNRPLAGVTVTVDGREQDLRAVTDVAGFFRLEPVPAGRFFVHIDGRTASASDYPHGAYYPAVGKAWEAVAGVRTNLAAGTGEIFLPLIQADALRSVSAVVPTEVGFPASVVATNPALALARIVVPPNSLFADDGTRGGRVGIAPVPPNRLPSPLPEGLELAMVFTVQTDGAGNFDQPAPVSLPNIPEVVADAPLPPGAKRSLISFDHKKGVWESVGLMTVSADGQSLHTDPGVGIRQPGWHGAGVPPFVGPAGGDGFSGGAAGQIGSGDGVTDGADPANGGGSDASGGGSSGGSGASPGGGGPGGGGGSGSGGPNGGNPGGGNGNGNGSGKGQPQSCRDANLAECFDRGVAEREKCKAARSAWYDQMTSACEALAERFGMSDPRVIQCYRDVGEGFKSRSRACHEVDRRMDDECAPCQHGPGLLAAHSVSSAPALHDGASVVDQILALQEAASEVLAPYVSASQPIPIAALAQARSLWQQADAVAGGSVGSFLEGELLALERELAGRYPAYELTPGNPPRHNLRFVATLIRGGTVHLVRGETGPYGAYELFVPADAVLLSVDFYDPKTSRWGSVSPNRRSEARLEAAPPYLHALEPDATDFDADGLLDIAEFVVGTLADNPDTDGDGLPDGTELAEGGNPLDGIAVEAGVVAAVDTPGRAVDVVADDDLAVVADGVSGIAIFNIANPTRPVIVAQLDTAGEARAVAISGAHVAVADGSAGLAIVDLAAGLPVQVRQQLDLGSAVVAACAQNGRAFVGLESRDLMALDLFTGIELARTRLPGGSPIQDVTLSRGVLYALTGTELHALLIEEGTLRLVSTVPAPGLLPGSLRRKRLSVAGDRLLAAHRQGFTVFDLSDPTQPVQLVDHVTPQFGWKQWVLARPNRVLAPGGANSTEGAAHDLQVYDLGPDGTNLVFQTTLPTPGVAQAVAVWKGLAFVADDAAGLQVVNFEPASLGGSLPTVTLTDPRLGNPAAVVEGQRFQLAARVGDEALVRTVEFYLDGTLVAGAGKHPFTCAVLAPQRLAGTDQLRVQARATDMAGRAAWSEAIEIELLEDPTPPQIEFTVPSANRYFGPLDWLVLGAKFNERVEAATVTPETFQLHSAGANGVWGDADDERLDGGRAGFRADVQTAWLSFDRAIPPGRYRASLAGDITDLAGNRLTPTVWNFEVFHADLQAGGRAEAEGRIERGGAVDVLALHARAGQQVYFDERTGTCTSGLRWRCVAPDGSVVFDEGLGGLSCGRDVGQRTLPVEGTYWITIRGVNAGTNAWSVAMYDVPPPTVFPIEIGTAVSADTPRAGAGRIETPGASDEYAFVAEAGQVVFFEEPQGECGSGLVWRCVGPQGEVVFEEVLGGLGCGRNAGRRVLPSSGSYLVSVQGQEDAIGPYAFAVWDATPQKFEVEATANIEDGIPEAGAGRIETPGASDVYPFTVAPGARLRFENPEASPGLTGVAWRLTDAAGAEIFETCLGCTSPGVVTLTTGGPYTLTIGDEENPGTGTYRLRLELIP